MDKRGKETKQYPEGKIPKVVKIENASSILILTFDNGETRYLKSHYTKDLVDAYSLTEGKKKRALLFGGASTNWMGTEIDIREDGRAVLNSKDIYTPEELWYDSKEHISEL